MITTILINGLVVSHALILVCIAMGHTHLIVLVVKKTNIYINLLALKNVLLAFIKVIVIALNVMLLA